MGGDMATVVPGGDVGLSTLLLFPSWPTSDVSWAVSWQVIPISHLF